MRKIRYLLLFIIGLFIPSLVMAASGNISVSGASTVMVGNQITITVTLSSDANIGSWQMSLNYDRAYLQLTSSSAESGGTGMAGSAASAMKKKSYTFKFKALKSGSTNVSVGSYLAYNFDDFSEISLTSSGKAIRIQTKEEIEASYSDDATLKKLEVEGYEIIPKFDSKVREYSLEVENDIEKVKVKAVKNNSNASFKGDGEIALEEGNNKVEIVVTSQKGNTLTYVLNIVRKELNPIQVNVNGSNYSLVRKSDELGEYTSFSATSVNYGGEDIPALYSDVLNKTLIGLKNNNGEIEVFVFDNGEIKEKYFELKSNDFVLVLKSIDKVDFKGFKETIIKINNSDVKVFKYKNLDKYYLVYATNLVNNQDNYYLYDVENGTYQVFDAELFQSLVDDNNFYLMMLCGSGGLIFVCLIVIIVMANSKGKKKIKKREKNRKSKNELDDDIENSEEDYNILEDN